MPLIFQQDVKEALDKYVNLLEKLKPYPQWFDKVTIHN